ncbi:MAG: hypothetical protein LBT93_07885 [Treponema sp.]|jgi:hypothetical protein|nr:hypothetical protein [Treponema sp.]
MVGKKIIPLLSGFLLFFCFPLSLQADPEISSGRELTLTLSTMPELKLGFNQYFIFPFLRGDNFLTADNNIRLNFIAEFSPISLNGAAELVWTPAAFLQLTGGTKLGSGWNIKLFGSPVYGIGINRPEADTGAIRTSKIEGSFFDGLLWRIYGGGALQFDFAALFPGDWHHLVFRSYHEGSYRAYSRASSKDSWVFENDRGENRNGLIYYGNLLLAYQMPIFLNTLGILTEAEKYLYNTPNRTDWGDELIRWTFSGLLNFTLTKQLDAALIVQCRTGRNYQDGDQKNKKTFFYQDRSLDRDRPLFLEFYRVAAILTLKLP